MTLISIAAIAFFGMDRHACAEELPVDFFENGVYGGLQQNTFAGLPFFEDYEDKKFELIKFFLPYNPVIVEVGAYEGATTLELSQNWPFGTIIAFEPNPYPFERFLKNTRNLKNVSGYPLALDDYPGSQKLYFQQDFLKEDPTWEEKASLMAPLSPINFQIEVNCVTLEDWCEEHHVSHVDFLYIDVDEWAVPILDGSLNLLNTVNVICTKTHLVPLLGGPSLYQFLHALLNLYGYELIAHWYDPMANGKAIYLKKTICNALYR